MIFTRRLASIDLHLFRAVCNGNENFLIHFLLEFLFS